MRLNIGVPKFGEKVNNFGILADQRNCPKKSDSNPPFLKINENDKTQIVITIILVIKFMEMGREGFK